MRRLVLGFMVIGFCLLASVAGAQEFHVSTLTDFQNALDTAKSNGENDVIYVEADITVTQTLTYTTPNGDSGHTLTIIGNSHSLDGGNSVQIMYINTDSGGTCDGDDAGGDITIKGLTFKNGNGNNNSEAGGLSVNTYSANVTIENNTFNDNRCEGCEGGAYVVSGVGNITLTNNTFSGNSSYGIYYSGSGGIHVGTSGNITLTNNTFSGNSSIYCGGGHFYSSHGNITLTSNTFYDNTASGNVGGTCVNTDYGTAILMNNTFSSNNAYGSAPDAQGNSGGASVITRSGTAILTNNTFSSNNAHGRAGGLYVFTPVEGTITLTNNTFYGNTAEKGGGAYGATIDSGTITLTNNTFYGNSAGKGGGAYVWITSSTVTLTNNAFYGNDAVNGGGLYGELYEDSATLQIYNNIIWGNIVSGGNSGSDLYVNSDVNQNFIGSIVKLYNNDLGPNSDFNSAQSKDLYITETDNYSHDGNITNDPRFVNPANGDFHLQANSPCIDAGDNNAPAIPATDFEGDQRVIDGDGDGNAVIDIGADEFYTGYHTLTIQIQGTGSGSVTSEPQGIDCSGGTCSAQFQSGTSVTLTASPDPGSVFNGWGGNCSSCGTDTTCTITMNLDKDCTATFNEIGDVDGNYIVDIVDALLASMNSLGIQVNGSFNFQAADVDGNDEVNMEDALGIAEVALGIQGF